MLPPFFIDQFLSSQLLNISSILFSSSLFKSPGGLLQKFVKKKKLVCEKYFFPTFIKLL